MTEARRGLGAVALDNNDYLVDALEGLRKHATMKLKESQRLYRKAGRNARADYFSLAERQYRLAEDLEDVARKDLEQIQRILANPNLNK